MPWNDYQKEPDWQDPHFSSGGNSAELAMFLAKRRTPTQQIAQALLNSAPELAKAYRGMQADQIAQQLLEQDDPQAAAKYKAMGLTGRAAQNEWIANQQGQQDDATNAINMQIKQAQLNKIQSGLDDNGSPAPPQVDSATGMVWNGRQWVHPQAGQRQPGDVTQAVDNQLMRKYGITSDDVSSVTGTPYQDETGKQISTEEAQALGNKAYAVVTPEGKNPVRVPYQEWGRILQRNANLNPAQSAYQSAVAGPQQAQTAASAAPPAAAIDFLKKHPETAAQFDAKYGQGASGQFL